VCAEQLRHDLILLARENGIRALGRRLAPAHGARPWLGGLPQRTGHGHGSGDDRKKNLSLHPVLEDGSPVKSALAVPLTKKQYQPLSLDQGRA
jgi:hypothetical protein